VVGPVIGYDQFEAPLIVFRDATNNGVGVVLGVRRDRFTSYGEAFYSSVDCSGSASYVRAFDTSGAPSPAQPNATASGDNGGFVGLPPVGYPPAGFVYQLQQASYAMGSGNILYRGDGMETSVQSTVLAPLSVWKSQDITPDTGGSPTPPCFTVPDGTTVDGLLAATPVIDFISEAGYVPPYRLAFPSPDTAGAPALPCPDNECGPPVVPGPPEGGP
jgi:hypothetical protein